MDSLKELKRTMAKRLKVNDMPVLTKEDLDRMHEEYMKEMKGTTPRPTKEFNPLFNMWEKIAREARYLGFRNVQEYRLFFRVSDDEMPNITPVTMHMKQMLTSVAYSIPTLPSLLAMVDTHNKIAEVGAGSGYLAYHLSLLGGDIVCCDLDVDKQPDCYYEVEEMDGREFITKHDGFPDRALLICWGQYKDGAPEQYEEMIRQFKGPFLYVIGEQRSDLCTFCLAMCDDDVQDQWVRIGVYDLPAFEDHRLYNQLVIYQRETCRETCTPQLQMRPTTRRGLDYL